MVSSVLLEWFSSNWTIWISFGKVNRKDIWISFRQVYTNLTCYHICWLLCCWSDIRQNELMCMIWVHKLCFHTKKQHLCFLVIWYHFMSYEINFSWSAVSKLPSSCIFCIVFVYCQRWSHISSCFIVLARKSWEQTYFHSEKNTLSIKDFLTEESKVLPFFRKFL